MQRRVFLTAALATTALAGCGSTPGEYATDEEIAQYIYRHDGPPALTFFTMVNNRSGAGAHASMMINASQRVVFDPAGSLKVNVMPERNDVLYGITPRVAEFYERAHARETYHVVIQRIEVTAEVAEKALQLAQQAGPVAGSQCAASIAKLLQQLPGFEGIRNTLFPNNLREQIAALPGVSERVLYEDDADDKGLATAAFEAANADQTQ
ncbi:MAG: hypothetical protein MK160_06905 [Rhodobacteraceae bacterium]|nr:hypothetical protein [Paracoccaceae bacterium]